MGLIRHIVCLIIGWWVGCNMVGIWVKISIVIVKVMITEISVVRCDGVCGGSLSIC